MIIKIKDDKNKNNDDNGHVIYIDKLTDHHIQDDKKKEPKRKKEVFPKSKQIKK